MPPSARDGSASAAGSITHSSMCSVRRWLDISKCAIESISSPQNSIRTGSVSCGEKKSRMPPRRAYWPGPSTCSVREYPQLMSAVSTSSGGYVPPSFISNAALRSAAGGSVLCTKPETDAAHTRLSPLASL